MSTFMVGPQTILFHWYQYHQQWALLKRNHQLLSLPEYPKHQRKELKVHPLYHLLLPRNRSTRDRFCIKHTSPTHGPSSGHAPSQYMECQPSFLYSMQPDLILCKTRDQGCKGPLGHQGTSKSRKTATKTTHSVPDLCFYPKWHWQGIATLICIICICSMSFTIYARLLFRFTLPFHFGLRLDRSAMGQ